MLDTFQAPTKVKKLDLLSTYSASCARVFWFLFSLWSTLHPNKKERRREGDGERERTPLHGEKNVFNKPVLRDASYPSGGYYVYIQCCNNLTI